MKDINKLKSSILAKEFNDVDEILLLYCYKL